MKKAYSLLLVISLSLTSYAQVKINEIYGKWTVEKVIEKPKEAQFEPVIDGFKKSTFVFNQDGSFNLITTSKSELFAEVTKNTRGTQWIYEKSKNRIRIGRKADGYSIMGILVQKSSDKIVFNLLESGIILEMKKVD